VSYLPPTPTDQTAWPEAYGKDIAVQIRLIDEKWKRTFPLLTYYQIKKATTPATDPNMPIGEAGKTQFDPVWGESVPADMASTGWRQPHGDAVADAADPELFEAPVSMNFRVQRIAKESELKKYGFDQIRDLLLFVPLSILDENSVIVTAGDSGDYVIWDGDEYTVLQKERAGYWKNTNVRLYMALNCEHRRPGA
jgi:hypothetical protein